jgi:cellobiose-specific phosphotransferase system component IIB
VQNGRLGIGTSFLLKKVSKIPKVKNITVPLIQAQHVVLVSGERILSQGKNQSPKI